MRVIFLLFSLVINCHLNSDSKFLMILKGKAISQNIGTVPSLTKLLIVNSHECNPLYKEKLQVLVRETLLAS